MHPRVIAQRQAAAHGRVLDAVKQIASNTGIEAPDLANVREKSPEVQRVKEWEALAGWLEGVANGTVKPVEPTEPVKKASKKESSNAKT